MPSEFVIWILSVCVCPECLELSNVERIHGGGGPYRISFNWECQPECCVFIHKLYSFLSVPSSVSVTLPSSCTQRGKQFLHPLMRYYDEESLLLC